MLNALIRLRLPISLLFVLLCGLAAWSGRGFEIDASADTLLTKDNRLFLESRLNKQKFAPEEFVLVAYRPHSGNVFSSEVFAVISELSERFAELERVEKVNSLTNIPLVSMAGDLSTDFNPQNFTWDSQQYSAEQMQQIFSGHPVYTDLLVNQAQTASAIQVVFADNPEQQELAAQILTLQEQSLNGELNAAQQNELSMLEAQAEELEQQMAALRSEEIAQLYSMIEDYQTDADIFLGGNYVLAEHLIEIISSDLLVFGLSISLCICVLLLIVFRDWRWVVLPLACCLISVVFTVGLFAFLEFKTTVISSNFIALQLILTLALVIHLIVQYQQLAQEHDEFSHHELLKETIRKKFQPCLYAGITTAIGFASLLLSGLQPVITFGWMMIVAMSVSIVISLVLFPTLLAFTGKRLSGKRHSLSRSILNSAESLSKQRPLTIITGSALVFITACIGISWLNVENSFLDYFRESTQVRQELVFIDRELGGSTPLDIIYRADTSENGDLLVTADQVQTLQQIQATLNSSAAVGKTMSVVNFTELARQLNEGQALTEYELNSIYILLDENLRQQLLGSYFDPESGDLRISSRIIDSSAGFDRAAFLRELRNSLEQLGLDEDEYSLTNLFVLYQDILERLYDSQIRTMGFVYLALGLVMLVIFRSLKTAIVALIPNIITTLMILGLMGWFAIPLDLMTITITAIAMGIAVDDTIHFVHHYLDAVENGEKDPLKKCFNTVGYAMLYTSVIIAIGFSTLMFSDFVPSILFGLLTALAMLLALLTALTLLPVLLIKAGVRR